MSQKLTTNCDRCGEETPDEECTMLRTRSAGGDRIFDLCEPCAGDLRYFLDGKPSDIE